MIHCPGCGFGFWHNWGVLVGMKPVNKLETISGSSLAAVCYLCNLDPYVEVVKCNRIRYTLFFAPKKTIMAWLRVSLPHNCAQMCNKKLVIMLRKLPSLELVYIDKWESKEDLIQSLIASISILSVHKIDGTYYTDCIYVRPTHKLLSSKTVCFVPSMRTAISLFEQGKTKGQKVNT